MLEGAAGRTEPHLGNGRSGKERASSGGGLRVLLREAQRETRDRAVFCIECRCRESTETIALLQSMRVVVVYLVAEAFAEKGGGGDKVAHTRR